ncbi:Hepatocyte growth factor receptor [Takifugu flavidus]|uniref:Hepatocyte growth factor receptor n=1 Tax=Takifugu flavidus TaxID=433684 RepID=A0A5C6PCL6_9TELE|nr:Hepatocyte growth factor receptor [Takifugu flavidus]
MWRFKLTLTNGRLQKGSAVLRHTLRHMSPEVINNLGWTLFGCTRQAGRDVFVAGASSSFLQHVSYFHDFHLREVDHQPGLFPLSSSAALPNDLTSTPVHHRGSGDTPLGCRGRHTPRARRSPWQVHQKCPGEKHNSLETAAHLDASHSVWSGKGAELEAPRRESGSVRLRGWMQSVRSVAGLRRSAADYWAQRKTKLRTTKVLTQISLLVCLRMNLCSFPAAVLLLWALSASAEGHCQKAPEPNKLNLSVSYELPTFAAEFPIQNVVTLDGIIYVGATNRIYALAPSLTKLSEYRTGPLLANQTCGQKVANASSGGGRKDNLNVALVVENIYDKGLFSCGSADNGVCRRHVLEDDVSLDEEGRQKSVDELVYCFTDLKQDKGQPRDSDVVVSPSGSQVLNVESNMIMFFVGNSEIPGSGNVTGPTARPHTMSLRKMKTSQNGFTFFSNQSYMDLIPPLRGSYYLRYVYSFHSGPFTYFLTVQQVSKDSQTYHTRIVRMCSSDHDIRRYVEMPLECISTDKRRRRSMEDVKVFNILQAATVTKVGSDVELQRQLRLEEGDDVLFAAFARGKPNSTEATPNSAICVMSLKLINSMFKMYMQKCNTVDLYHFTGSDKKSCYNVGISSWAEDDPIVLPWQPAMLARPLPAPLNPHLFPAPVGKWDSHWEVPKRIKLG